MSGLINTTLNKSSKYAEFEELFVKPILKGYGRVEVTADCYKSSIKSSEHLSINQKSCMYHHFFERFQMIFTIGS